MNKEVFEKVFLPLSDKLFRFAKKYLVSGDEARDAVQEGAYTRYYGDHHGAHAASRAEHVGKRSLESEPEPRREQKRVVRRG